MVRARPGARRLPGSTEETILTEIVANALDSGASTIMIAVDPAAPALTIVDDGRRQSP